jgi:hypothetical protein
MLPLCGGPELNSKQARQNLPIAKDGLLAYYRSNEKPTSTMEALLELSPLYLQLEVEAKAKIYRLYCNDQSKLKSEGSACAWLRT